MSISLVFLIILFAALCHASWSAIVKKSTNSLVIMAITSIVEIIVFLPLIFFVPLPTVDIWYFLIATTVLHGCYRYSVIISYNYGDLSFIYPIARGGSCLIIGAISIFLISSDISFFGIMGIIITCIGLFMISFISINKFNKKGFLLAISTASLIATYTIIDGIGVRNTENAFTYIFWMLLLNGIPMLIYAFISKNGFQKKNTYNFTEGAIAGVLAILGYGLVVWSMQFIEIAYVSSIREVSIVLATIISLYLLKEKAAKKRILPSILIVTGVTVVYLQIN